MSVDDRSLKLPTKIQRESTSLSKIGLLVICAAMCYLGVVSRRPYDAASQIRTSNHQLEKQILALKLKNQQLKSQSASINTETSMKIQLRENNYTKPNEVPLIIYMK